MKDTITLQCVNGNVFEIFRDKKNFEGFNLDIMNPVFDETWDEDELSSKEFHLSSPTVSVLGRYFVHVLVALLFLLNKNNVKKILVVINNNVELDNYSRKILNIISECSDVHVAYKYKVEDAVSEILTVRNLKRMIKRGFYDNVKTEDQGLKWIYNYYKYLFYSRISEKENLNSNYSLLKVIEQLEKTADDYQKRVIMKSVINQSIREKKQDIALRYLIEYQKIAKDDFDYINSYSYYLKEFFSTSEAVSYLRTKIDIVVFLKKRIVDYGESLMYKNYASLIGEGDTQRIIIQKCLEQTPQDIDLLSVWLKFYANDSEKTLISNRMFSLGTLNFEILKNVKFESDDLALIFRAIIITGTTKNKDISKQLIEQVQKKVLRIRLEKILDNLDLRLYITGRIKP